MEACAWQGVGHGVGVSGHLLGGSGLIIIPLIDFKIAVDNPLNLQLFLFGRLVIIVIIVDSFTYLCSNEMLFGSLRYASNVLSPV